MTATVIQLHAAAPPQPARTGLNLSEEEVLDAAAGYVYPARQLRELHARGYVLATLGKHGRVVLPRAHYEAVNSGQFRPAEPEQKQEQPAPRANRARLMRRFEQGRSK